MTEALIDFGEGEDLEEGVYDHGTFFCSSRLAFGVLTWSTSAVARELIQQLRITITGHLADSRRGEILRSGLRLAIFGPPNAGKSSLLNYFGMLALQCWATLASIRLVILHLSSYLQLVARQRL